MFCSSFGREMVFVAVGWQVYDIDRKPFHLGLIGLAEFLPLLLAFDRTTRQLVRTRELRRRRTGRQPCDQTKRIPSWDGFDERLGAGTRMGWRRQHRAFFCLTDRGHRVLQAPAASAYHPYPDTDGEVRRPRVRQLQSTSAHLALLAEQRRYRRCSAKYGSQAVARQPRTRRPEARAPHLEGGIPRAHASLEVRCARAHGSGPWRGSIASARARGSGV